MGVFLTKAKPEDAAQEKTNPEVSLRTLIPTHVRCMSIRLKKNPCSMRCLEQKPIRWLLPVAI
jgi:hypothetical protein